MAHELVDRIVSNTGVAEDTAAKSVGLILGFLQKEGPAAEVSDLMAKIPGAADLMTNAGAAGGGGGGLMGGLMGMMGGGGIMGLGQQLMGAGLSMGQIQTVSRELFAYGKEKAGEDTMGAIVGGIPGLSQFV